METVSNVLVPVDFSETSGRALAYARMMAEKFHASLHLLHVIPDPQTKAMPVVAAGAAAVAVEETRQAMEADARQQLADIDGGSAARDATIQFGHPFVEIVRFARDRKVDLIVMGTHGRGAIAHMLLGSVAEKVVRKATCPVLTVRHPEHSFERP